MQTLKNVKSDFKTAGEQIEKIVSSKQFKTGAVIFFIVLLMAGVYIIFRRMQLQRAKGAPKGKQNSSAAALNNIVAKKEAKAKGKVAARFIKNPAVFNQNGVKRPAKDRRRIKEYQKNNNGKLPADVESELI